MAINGRTRFTFLSTFKEAGVIVVSTLALAFAPYSSGAGRQGQPTLQITAPSSGTIVNPGQTATVNITSNFPAAFQGVALLGDDPLGFVGTVSVLPGQISVSIPTSAITCGSHILTVEGTPTSGGGPIYASISIDVERPDFAVSLSATLPGLAFESLGEQAALVLLADFSDGTTFRVSGSSYVAYSSSSNAVASVNSSGIVTAIGAGSASITATYTVSGQSLQIFIPVNVSPPKLAISPASLTFASQSVGTSSPPQQLTLTNVSPDSLSLLALTASGDFSEADNCIALSPLGTNSACTANVIFSPTAAGARTGSLSIANSANIVPISITLSGTGTTAPAITTLSPSSGTVGASVTITGVNFGASQGTSTVTFNGVATTPTSWGTTSIVTPVPNGATTGNVVVTVGGVSSSGVSFTVQGTTNGIVLVQHMSIDAGTATSSSLSFSSNNAAGNWIAVCIRAGVSGRTFTVTDSKGNSYRQAVQLDDTLDAPNGNTLAIFYAENVSGGANTVTVSDIGSSTLRFAILEYTGVATANSLDVIASAQGSSTSANSGNATTTANGDLVLGAIATADVASFTAPSGVQIEERVPAENTKLIAEDKIQTSAGTASASATLGGTDPWGAVLAAFKKAHP